MRLARAQSIREAPPHPHLAEPIREHYLVRTASARDPSPGIIHKDATTSRVPSTGTREAPSTATSRDDTLKPRAANNVAKSACTHLHSDPPSRPGSTTPAGPPLGHRTRRDRCPSAAEAACPPPPDAPGGRRRVLRLPAWLSGPSKHLSGAHDDPRGDVSWSVMVARHHREAARIPNDLPSTASVPAGLVRAALRAVDAICSPSLGVRVQVPAVVSLTQAFLWCRTPLQCQVLCAEVSSKRLAKSLRALLSSGEVYSTW